MSKWKVGETYKTRDGENAVYMGDVGTRKKDGDSHLFVIDGGGGCVDFPVRAVAFGQGRWTRHHAAQAHRVAAQA